MRIKNIVSIAAISLMALSFIVAPAGQASAQAAQVLTNIIITPPAASVAPTGTAQFTAVAYDQYGQPMATQPTFFWDSDTPDAATIDQNGLATGVAAGFAWISATDPNDPNAIMGYSPITVEDAPSASVLTVVTINPPAASVGVGGTVQLTASGYDQHGVLMSPQPAFTWTNSDGFATVDANGLVTGSTIGAELIMAEALDEFGQALTNSVSINVTDAPVLTSITVAPTAVTLLTGATQQLTTTVLDQNGSPFVGATVTYVSSDTAIATVDAAGLVTTVSAGTATITASATSGATTVTDTSVITVEAPVLTSITLTPGSATISLNMTQQFTAVGLDQNGNPLVPQPVFTWSSENSLLATVDANGLATGIAGGMVDIIATSGTMTAASSLTVEAPILTSITVNPATATVMVNGTQQLTTTVLDQNGSPFVGATVTYVSSDTAIATVDAAGLVTTVSAGTATITATATSGTATVTNTSVITVEAPVLTSITLTPGSAILPVAGTRQFTATGLDQNGNVLATQPTFTWVSSATGTASVNSSGLVTGITAGSSTITVSVGAINNSSTVSVQLLGVTQISAVQTFATADNTYTNGWKWVLSATVPTNETMFQMKFGDWTSGINSIAAASNIRFYSAQSSDANSATTAIEVTAANTLSSALTLNSDLDPTAEGRQIQIVIEAKIPTGSAGGSYTTSYGIQTNAAAL